MRASRPYVEPIEGITHVRAGERVERDDGWWRAYVVRIWNLPDDPDFGYRSEVEWRPVDPDTHEDLGHEIGQRRP